MEVRSFSRKYKERKTIRFHCCFREIKSLLPSVWLRASGMDFSKKHIFRKSELKERKPEK